MDVSIAHSCRRSVAVAKLNHYRITRAYERLLNAMFETRAPPLRRRASALRDHRTQHPIRSHTAMTQCFNDPPTRDLNGSAALFGGADTATETRRTRCGTRVQRLLLSVLCTAVAACDSADPGTPVGLRVVNETSESVLVRVQGGPVFGTLAKPLLPEAIATDSQPRLEVLRGQQDSIFVIPARSMRSFLPEVATKEVIGNQMQMWVFRFRGEFAFRGAYVELTRESVENALATFAIRNGVRFPALTATRTQ
jgi:hypothetical protein